MNVNSATASRQRSIDESDETQTAGTSTTRSTGTERAAAHPDWERIPTTSIGAGPIAADRDAKALKPKLERLARDVNELRTALGPYMDQAAQLHHALDEIKEAVEAAEQTAHHPWLAPIAAHAIHRAIAHGIPEAKHAFEGMQKTAPDAAAKAKPILERIVQDVKDLQGSLDLAPASLLERMVPVRG